MSNNDKCGGTRLVGENGEQMDPAVAGITPPGEASMQGDSAGAAIGADLEDDDAVTPRSKHSVKKTANPM